MAYDRDTKARVRRLERALARQLGLRRGGLDVRARRARRQMPRAVARDLLAVAEAAHLAGNPRIARTQDQSALRAAEGRVVAWLHGGGAADQRRGRRLGWLGALAVNLWLVAALVAGVLVWRGLL